MGDTQGVAPGGDQGLLPWTASTYLCDGGMIIMRDSKCQRLETTGRVNVRKLIALTMLVVCVNSSFGKEYTSSVGKTLLKTGDSSCSALAERAVKLVSDGWSEGSDVMVLKEQPNQRSISGVVVVQHAEGSRHGTLVLTPVGDACDLTYTLTWYVPDSCLEFKENSFGSFSYSGQLIESTAYYKKPDSVKTVYVSPLRPEGCLVTVRESGYGLK